MKAVVSSLIKNFQSHYEVVYKTFEKGVDKEETNRLIFENGAFEEAQQAYFNLVVEFASKFGIKAEVELYKGSKVIGREVFDNNNKLQAN